MIETYGRVNVFTLEVWNVNLEATLSIFFEPDLVRWRTPRDIDGVTLTDHSSDSTGIGPDMFT